MSATDAPAYDPEVEKSVLGGLMLLGDPLRVAGVLSRGLRPEHFYLDVHGAVFSACVSLSDRQSAVDPITVYAELDRLGKRGGMTRGSIEELSGWVPSAGNTGAYADRVIELARWRDRMRAAYEMEAAAATRDERAWARAAAALESAHGGTRTESYSADALGSLLFDYFAASEEERRDYAIPTPFAKLTDTLGGGLVPGEVCAVSGPTSHGKSIFVDQWLDVAAKHGKRCHLYMTEMTAIMRGLRLLARRTGVSFLKQRRRDLSDSERGKILAELSAIPYGLSVAADWSVDDIVRDALRARYDFVVVDLLHGFHYEDERGLDRLSKAMQRLARVSTTVNGHRGTAVVAVCHLKEEGLRGGKVPRPTLASLKGGSSIKQDADVVCFVWQDQEDGAVPSGVGEIWTAKGRGSGIERVDVRLNPTRFRFDLRDPEELSVAAARGDEAPAF